MSLLERAELTLERNLPNGLSESALVGSSCWTWARYFSAPLVSPDLMADTRPESAVPNELLDLDDALVSDALEELERPDKSETLL